MPDITLPNPQYCVFIKMMLFDLEVGPTSKGGMWQEGRKGEEINECYSETKENLKTREGSSGPRG
jgi:hypothetical protein